MASQILAKSGVGTRRNSTRSDARQRRTLSAKPNSLRGLGIRSGATRTDFKVEDKRTEALTTVGIDMSQTETREEVTTVVTDADLFN